MHSAATAQPIDSAPRALGASGATRALLIGTALLFLAGFLVLPLVAVFAWALRDGAAAYARALIDPAALSAIKLTLLAAAIAVPLNTAFGLAAAWLLARFPFRGRSALATVIDLPFSISPVVAGLMLVLLFGNRGWFGPWLGEHGLRVLFSVPAIVIATVFVTFPFVVREVLPVLQASGAAEEEAALTLGASGWQTFWHVTLPKVRWGLFHGVVLATARAMGEFGAVSVVSGHIQGLTNTIPLHVEILYNEYSFTASFAVASVLCLVAVFALAAKKLVGPGRRSAPVTESESP